jgi:hypothetical protein
LQGEFRCEATHPELAAQLSIINRQSSLNYRPVCSGVAQVPTDFSAEIGAMEAA